VKRVENKKFQGGRTGKRGRRGHIGEKWDADNQGENMTKNSPMMKKTGECVLREGRALKTIGTNY